jgi:hypothetical protein
MFVTDTKANISFKKTLGKAHTGNDREVFNEPDSSQFIIAAQDIWAKAVYPNPADVRNATACTPLLTLDLVPIVGTNNFGKYASYYVKIPTSGVPASLVGKTNRLTGAPYVAGERIGQIIPRSMGPLFQAKPYAGSTPVYPMDASDWYLDCFSGILSQETDNPAFMRDYNAVGSKIECYVYTGTYVSDSISGLGGGQTYSFYDKQVVGGGISGIQDGANRVFSLNNDPVAGSEHVYLNGLLLRGGIIDKADPTQNADYSIVGNIITFAANYTDAGGRTVVKIPTADDLFQVSYRSLVLQY